MRESHEMFQTLSSNRLGLFFAFISAFAAERFSSISLIIIIGLLMIYAFTMKSVLIFITG